MPAPGLNRRALLQWGALLTAGAVLPGCGGGGGPRDDLPEPQALRSVNGVLELHLNVGYASMDMDLPDSDIARWARYPADRQPGRRLELRSFNGRYTAPTLWLRPGDTLKMWVHNQLPASPQGSDWALLNHQNSTNMHFHGLHVDPREIRPGVFGDYVVDGPDAGIAPGATRYHEIHLPDDHSCGIYWYHPHLHGATNAQVSSGMFGAIIVADAQDPFRASVNMRERVLFAHKLTVNAKGRTDTLEDSMENPAGAFLLNGAYQPTIVMRPGEVQHWHIVNPSSFYPLHPVLDGHVMNVYGRDGNHYGGIYRPLSRQTAGQPLDMRDWPGNYIYPGGRLSMVVQASMAPGEYFLRAAACPSFHRPSGNEPFEEVLARVVVQGEPVQARVPDPALLRRPGDYTPITDAELASHGGVQRVLRLAVLADDEDKGVRDPALAPMPAGESWVLKVGGNRSVFAVGTEAMPLGMSPIHSSLTPVQTVPFNAVEEWTIYNYNGYPHPFHIHVNDCYVVRVNGAPVTPFWADTLPVPPGTGSSGAAGLTKGSITFRMRFADFHGKFVWHCHALDHEDLGMMQIVDVRP